MRAGSRAGLLLLSCSACYPEVVEANDVPATEGDSASVADDTGESSGSAGSSDSTAGTSDSTDSTTTGTDSTTTGTDSTTDGTTGLADCFGNDDCPGGNCLDGQCVVVSSCRNLDDLDFAEMLPSGVYELDPDGPGPEPPYQVFCELERAGGGWTLVLKSDGNSGTFSWGSPQWMSADPFQPEFPDFDRREAKLASYAKVPVTEMLIGMEAPVGADPAPLNMHWITVPTGGASLWALIAPGQYIPTAVGRDTWKSLVDGASLQPNCNREGFNASGGMQQHHRVRIGIIGNEQNDCNSPNSRIGIGGAGDVCNTWSNATGNFAGCESDNGDVNYIGFAAVFVR